MLKRKCMALFLDMIKISMYCMSAVDRRPQQYSVWLKSDLLLAPPFLKSNWINIVFLMKTVFRSVVYHIGKWLYIGEQIFKCIFSTQTNTYKLSTYCWIPHGNFEMQTSIQCAVPLLASILHIARWGVVIRNISEKGINW